MAFFCNFTLNYHIDVQYILMLSRPILVLPPTDIQLIECEHSEAEAEFYNALFRKSKVSFLSLALISFLLLFCFALVFLRNKLGNGMNFIFLVDSTYIFLMS